MAAARDFTGQGRLQRTACGSSAVGLTLRLPRATFGGSIDGKQWNRITETAWKARFDLSMTLVFDDKMWFMGGWYNGRLPGHSASNEEL